MRFEVFISVLIGGGLALGWALTGAHGHFWPAWVCFGLGVPLWLQGSVLWGLRPPPGRRALPLHLSASFALSVMFLVIWMLAGFHYFWPVWPILGLGVLLALHVWMARGRIDAREQALTDRVDVLTRTRRGALDIQAAELQRIERDLHDGAQARLVAMGMTLDVADQMLEGEPAAARALLAEARESSAKALAELRALVRGIHPPVLADRGLAEAVRALALDLPLRVRFASELTGRPPAPIESAAYFAVSELLANVSKHAGATQTWIDIRYTDGMLRVGVSDNGRGGADPQRGTGLRGIERRVAAFDGVLAVHSPPGGPTAVTIEISCALSSLKTSSC